MSRIVMLACLAVAVAGVVLWATGSFDHLSAWAAQQQRAFQNQMAMTLRALRAGQPGAVMALMGACFSYGVVHAVGPGHGKVLIGGYGLGRDVPKMRLAVISLLASLAQAGTAIVLVYVGVFFLGLGRTQLVGTAEDIFAPASYAAIAAVGAWLAWRGVRRLLRRTPAHAPHHGHGSDHDHDHVGEGHECASCGHAHGPSVEQIAQTRSVREAIVLIAGIAARPCTGALFVLILTWQMGIAMAGIFAALAMGLGTAVVTIAAGLGAGALRGGFLGGLNGPWAARAVPVIELVAGGMIVLVATGLLLRAL